jgi:putative transposase
LHVKLNGHSHSGNQRFLCKACGYSFTFHNFKNKRHREKNSFIQWITEGYSVRQLVAIGPHGIWKVNQTRRYWLERLPSCDVGDLSAIRCIQFDGTYFKHENCLMVVMDNLTARVIGHRYHYRENYACCYALFTHLKEHGLEPSAITIDGNTSVIRALKAVWPKIRIQRCITHIQRQGLAWLRRYPKLEASRQLRKILLRISDIKDEQGKNVFISSFVDWEKQYSSFVKALPSKDKVYGDLQRARSLIVHALPNMFHYLDDRNIAATTNRLEGYFSRLKELYRRHRGLSKQHRQNYFAWYIYFKNGD